MNFLIFQKKLGHGFVYGSLTALSLTFNACKTNDGPTTPSTTTISKTADNYTADVATTWADMDFKLIRTSPGFTPPVAARALGYSGLTMYESAVAGVKGYRSLSGQLSGLSNLPQPDATKEYHWGEAVNAGQAYIARNIWANTTEASKKTIDSLETAFEISYKKDATAEVITRSKEYGTAIAQAIFEWSKTDGGHEGYLRNFPTSYTVPVFPGAWQPTENGKKIPMQPYWGKNRSFVVNNSILPAPEPLVISTDINSSYFKQYNDVYVKNKSLTQAEKEISIWWADDPSETFTPPGHSYNLAKIAVKTSNVKLDKAIEAFGRVGLAVNDAFISCWKCKFTFNNERPYTFVRRAIDPNWIPFWPAPPFPGYISGHSTQSMTTAMVLTSVFGSNFAFTDDSHVGRIKDTKRNVEFKARSYKSFVEAAEESGYSRILGGIHTSQDNLLGLAEGKKIAANINALKWKN